MYNELQAEGYTEVNIMGINGFQYLDNDYHCMICDTPDECSSCDEERVLPWGQDLDASFNGLLGYLPDRGGVFHKEGGGRIRAAHQ